MVKKLDAIKIYEKAESGNTDSVFAGPVIISANYDVSIP